MAQLSSCHRRPGRAWVNALVFLTIFGIGVAMLAIWYLRPAFQAYHEAEQLGNQKGTRTISATAALLLVVVLFVLLAGLALTLRFGRFFFPRKNPPRTRTNYPDAWAESGRRMQTPPPDEDNG